MNMTQYGYTPFWNLSVSELLHLQRTNPEPDKQLETELARRLSILVRDGHVPESDSFVPD